MINSIAVGLGELKISRDANDVLVGFGLGSCLGIGFFDPAHRLACLLHAILPCSPNGTCDNPTRYVDSGVRMMLDTLVQAGADPRRLVIRMAGGARMLVEPSFSQVLNIGPRNVEAAYQTFKELNLSLASQEVGGTIGRTVRFYGADGRMTIRTVGNQEREI